MAPRRRERVKTRPEQEAHHQASSSSAQHQPQQASFTIPPQQEQQQQEQQPSMYETLRRYRLYRSLPVPLKVLPVIASTDDVVDYEKMCEQPWEIVKKIKSSRNFTTI